MNITDYFQQLESHETRFDIGCGNTIRDMFKRAYSNRAIASVVYEVNVNRLPVNIFTARLLAKLNGTTGLQDFTDIVAYVALLSKLPSLESGNAFDYLAQRYNQTGMIDLISTARQIYRAPQLLSMPSLSWLPMTYFAAQSTQAQMIPSMSKTLTLALTP